MNLIILDADFQPLAPINTCQTLIWDRRYREPGMFELDAGPEDFDAIRGGAYVYRSDREEFGIIYEANLKRSKNGAKSCYAKGYFGEMMLNDRVLNTTQRMKGTPEAIARALVARYLIEAEDGAGDYPGRSLGGHLILGELSDYTEQATVEWQGSGSTLGDALYKLEAEQMLSHRVHYDYLTDKLVFSVWRGKDRNALISDKFGNLTETRYHRDTTDAPNVVYVAGAGDGPSRKVYRLDLRGDGDAAREMYVDARDLQQIFIGEDGQSYSYTDEDYDELLKARGQQMVEEHKAQERFEASLDATANLVYREDYDLGDFCLAEVDGVQLERQITGIREVYENGATTLEVTLGDYATTKLSSIVSKQAQVNVSSPPSTDLTVTGNLNQLKTTDKTNLVAAINEVAQAQSGGSGSPKSSWPPVSVYRSPTEAGNKRVIKYLTEPGAINSPVFPVSESSGQTRPARLVQVTFEIDGPFLLPPKVIGAWDDRPSLTELNQTKLQIPCNITAVIWIREDEEDSASATIVRTLKTSQAIPFTILSADWSYDQSEPDSGALSLTVLADFDQCGLPFTYATTGEGDWPPNFGTVVLSVPSPASNPGGYWYTLVINKGKNYYTSFY